MPGPLGDVVILEACREGAPLHLRLAIAMAGRALADQGARVLCLVPPGGDPLGQVPPLLPDGSSGTEAFLAAGKERIICADKAEFERGLEVLAARAACVLVASADESRDLCIRQGAAVIELADVPEAVERRMGDQPSTAFTLAASSGFLDIIGDPAREPLRIGGHQLSYSAGLAAFTACTAAIMQRDLDGRALHARVSILETAIWMNWKAVVGSAGPGPHSSRRGALADFPVLRCKDGWVALVYTPVQFERMVEMFAEVGPVDPRTLPQDERAGSVSRQLAPWFEARTRAEIYAEARHHGIPLGPIYSPAELLADEQYLARDFFVGIVSVDAFPARR